MKYNFEKISEEIQKENFKIFVSPEFKSIKKIKTIILGEMPDYESYLNTKNKLKIKNVTFADYHLEEPVLTKEQEKYFFRKMHYYKYLCKKNLTNYNKTKQYNYKKKVIESFSLYQEIRHLIHKANVKLVSQSLKKRRDFYGANHLNDLFSDAFLNILQAIDHFDYRRNIKFSTFACWCLLNNSIRDHQKNKKFDLYNVSNCENGVFEKIDEKSEDLFLKFDSSESGISDWVKIKEYFLNVNRTREVQILEKVFGLGGEQRLSINEIASEFNLTKERIRQLREKTLSDIKTLVEIGRIKIDGI